MINGRLTKRKSNWARLPSSGRLNCSGGLDILVNSAGVGDDLPLEESDELVWDTTMKVNLKGTFFCYRAAFGALREARGAIINIASDAGLMGNPNSSVYCASKGGVVNMTRSLALELAPQEIAASVLYLASAEAGFVTGAALPNDGGLTADH